MTAYWTTTVASNVCRPPNVYDSPENPPKLGGKGQEAKGISNDLSTPGWVRNPLLLLLSVEENN